MGRYKVRPPSRPSLHRPTMTEKQREQQRVRQRTYDAKPEVRAHKSAMEQARNRRPERKEKLRAYRKAYRQRPGVKERERAHTDEYYKQPEVRAKKQAYDQGRRKKPEVRARLRELYIQREYGLSMDAYESMFKGQGEVCAACGSNDWSHSRGKCPVVDHDHNTGDVRGILCHRCNVAIGLLRDDPRVARLLAEYLERR